MKKGMKNKLLILLCALMLNGLRLLAQDSTYVANVSIERDSDKTSYIINLIIENTMSYDTLVIGSNYFIDENRAPAYILIYRCKKETSTDSIKCDWGYSHGDIAPNSVSFSNEKLIKILPKERVILKMPISHYYIGDEIFLEIRMVCSKGKKDGVFLITRTTNKILFEKELDKYEKYQIEKLQKK